MSIPSSQFLPQPLLPRYPLPMYFFWWPTFACSHKGKGILGSKAPAQLNKHKITISQSQEISALTKLLPEELWFPILESPRQPEMLQESRPLCHGLFDKVPPCSLLFLPTQSLEDSSGKSSFHLPVSLLPGLVSS